MYMENLFGIVTELFKIPNAKLRLKKVAYDGVQVMLIKCLGLTLQYDDTSGMSSLAHIAMQVRHYTGC